MISGANRISLNTYDHEGRIILRAFSASEFSQPVTKDLDQFLRSGINVIFGDLQKTFISEFIFFGVVRFRDAVGIKYKKIAGTQLYGGGLEF